MSAIASANKIFRPKIPNYENQSPVRGTSNSASLYVTVSLSSFDALKSSDIPYCVRSVTTDGEINVMCSTHFTQLWCRETAMTSACAVYIDNNDY